jgi:hypothetical protein
MSFRYRLLSLAFLAFALTLLSGQNSKQQPGKNQPPPPEPDPGEYARGFKAGLEQHQELLNETRQELEQVRREVEKVKSNNDWFLALYGLVTALLLGEGVLSLNKQKSQSEEIRKKAGDAAELATKAAADAATLANQTQDIATKSKAEMDKILAARKALFSELPVYLEEKLQAASALNPGTFDLFQKADVNEVDHLTYLGSTSFRFHEPETDDERKTYCDSLLFTVRGHMVQMRPVEALKRIDMFFKLSKDVASIKDAERSRMYGYRAHAYMSLLDQLKSDLALNRPESRDKARTYRKEVVAALENAKTLNVDWAGARFYEAYFYSLYPVSPDITDPQERRQFFLDGQQRAIDKYRSLIHDHTKLLPNMVGEARINICCCLKRLADDSGDYKPLFDELATYPSETQIRSNNAHNTASIDQTSDDLWSNLMQEGVFFANKLTGTYPVADYKIKWVDTLNINANLSPWRDRYVHFLTPTMRSWSIRVWEP